MGKKIQSWKNTTSASTLRASGNVLSLVFLFIAIHHWDGGVDLSCLKQIDCDLISQYKKMADYYDYDYDQEQGGDEQEVSVENEYYNAKGNNDSFV
jgi:hypothetical protein